MTLVYKPISLRIFNYISTKQVLGLTS